MNSDGGVSVIGIDDNARIVGLKDKKNWDRWSQHLDNLIYSRYQIHRKLSDYIYTKKETDNNDSIAVIKIQTSPEPVWMRVKNDDVLFIRTHNVAPSLRGKAPSEYISIHWHHKNSRNGRQRDRSVERLVKYCSLRESGIV